MFCRNLCVGWAWSPAQEFCALASLGSHGSWAVDWLMSFVLSTLGLSRDGTQPSRAPLSDATSLKLEPREILLSFFFFFELELSVISTQSQGRGPLRKINLSAFFLAHSGSGCLGTSMTPSLLCCLCFPDARAVSSFQVGI